MKLTLEHYDEKITIEKERDDLDIWELAELLRNLVLATGFSESNVDDIIVKL